MNLLILTTICSLLIVSLIPKRLTGFEVYVTSLFAATFGAMADMFLDVKLNWYGFLGKGIDWSYLFIFFIIYPAASIVFLNFYPLKKTRAKRILYILFFSVITTIFEFIASKYSTVFYHNDWKLIYSLICYPFLYSIMAFHFKYVRSKSNHL